MADAAPPPAIIRTETNGPMVTALAIFLLMINVVFLSLRFITRGLILKAVGKDDLATLAAGVLAITCSIAVCFEVKYGMGRHVENVTPEETIMQLKALMVAICSYTQGMNLIKLGFLFQYRRIFSHVRYVQTVCFWFIVFVFIWAVVQLNFLFFMCFPYSVINPSMVGRCLDTLPIWYLTAALSMATDFAIFCIPLPAAWRLQLRARQKVMVLGIFSLGFFVCIVSVYRLFTLYPGVVSTDPTWDNIGAAIWSIVELTAAIVASCLPTLRPLLARVLPGIGLSSARNGYSRSRSAYLRQGSTGGGGLHRTKSAAVVSSAAGDRGGNQTDSFNSEELALRDIGAGSVRTDVDAEEMGLGAGRGVGMPSGTYANASSDHQPANLFASDKQHNVGGIMMTTKITVDSGAR
ncbi:hypothetical protein RB601_002667 [Gaeumannomyces tritici]